MTEQYISDNTASQLNGTTLPGGLPIPAWDTTDWATPAARLYDRFRRLFGPAGELEVFKDGDLTFGVRAGSFLDGDDVVTFTAVDGEALTDDDTNYIYLIDDGTLTVSLTGFPNPSATPHIPLATIAVGSESAAAVSGKYDFVDIVDYRGRGLVRLLIGQTADQQNSGGGSFIVKNVTGSQQDAGDHGYFSGVSAGYPTTTSAGAIVGLVGEVVYAEDIADGATGRALTVGIVENVDTSSWGVGTRLYLGDTGAWTSTAPTAAGSIVQPVGVVLVQHATTGSVFAYPGLIAVTKVGSYSLQIGSVGATELNAAQSAQTRAVAVEDLGAGEDIAARPVFVDPRALVLSSIGILTQGAPAGVDDANTVVIDLKDDAANSILSTPKTYDTANQPPSSDYGDLGALDGTHKSLAALEHVTLDVTCGAAANMPALMVIFTFVRVDA